MYLAYKKPTGTNSFIQKKCYMEHFFFEMFSNSHSLFNCFLNCRSTSPFENYIRYTGEIIYKAVLDPFTFLSKNWRGRCVANCCLISNRDSIEFVIYSTTRLFIVQLLLIKNEEVTLKLFLSVRIFFFRNSINFFNSSVISVCYLLNSIM